MSLEDMLEDDYQESVPKKSKTPKNKSKGGKQQRPVRQQVHEEPEEQTLSPKELKKLQKEEAKRAKQLEKELKKSQKKTKGKKNSKAHSEPEIIEDDSWLESMQNQEGYDDDDYPDTAELDEFFSQPSVNERGNKKAKKQKEPKIKKGKQAKPQKGNTKGKKKQTKKNSILNIGGHSNKCTNPKFRKEDVHSATIPILDIECLYLAKDMQMLYPDELMRQQQNMYDDGMSAYDDVSRELDMFPPVLQADESNFDADSFLSDMEELNVPVIQEYEEHEDLTNYMAEEQQEDSVEFSPDLFEDDPALPDLEDEEDLPLPFLDDEEDLPLPDIDEIDVDIPELPTDAPKVGIKRSNIPMGEETVQLGSNSKKPERPSTSITFNKEHLSNMLGGKR